MSSESQDMEEQPEIKIRRPLDIGYELLPDGVSAVDFIEYHLVPLQKPTRYRKDEIPHHDLFGDKAVIRRELLEDEPIQHSELWFKIVSKLNPEILPGINSKTNLEKEYLQCHLVDEPMRPRFLPSLLPRKFVGEDGEVILGETEKKSKADGEEQGKKRPMFDFEALDKLKETVNWLKFCEEESEDDTDSD